MKLAFLVVGGLLMAGPIGAQVQQPPNTAEISKILGIKTWRVRKPWRAHDIWSIEMIGLDKVKPEGDPGSSLTRRGYLLALRESEDSGSNNTYRFTLPQQALSYSSGVIDLCKDLDCGATEISFFPHPRYSKDGSQCLLAKLKTLDGTVRYLALVLASYTPQNSSSK